MTVEILKKDAEFELAELLEIKIQPTLTIGNGERWGNEDYFTINQLKYVLTSIQNFAVTDPNILWKIKTTDDCLTVIGFCKSPKNPELIV